MLKTLKEDRENATTTLKNCFKLVVQNNLSERDYYSLRQMHVLNEPKLR